MGQVRNSDKAYAEFTPDAMEAAIANSSLLAGITTEAQWDAWVDGLTTTQLQNVLRAMLKRMFTFRPNVVNL